ncbi:hypothetical protein J6590_106527 [Homalodisca vitripennis]|nr:hypothetical protein J6590_106527 [Homalodisca vitripennis]
MADVVDMRDVKQYKPRLPTLPRDFKELHRFNEDNVEWLANRFLVATVETRGGALSSVHKTKICLRYLADPGYQKGIGQELGIDQATVSRSKLTYSTIHATQPHTTQRHHQAPPQHNPQQVPDHRPEEDTALNIF